MWPLPRLRAVRLFVQNEDAVGMKKETNAKGEAMKSRYTQKPMRIS
jgi:hypothetical protein